MPQDLRHQLASGAKLFFPVVHVVSEEQALANVALALAAGGDGVFLIDHYNHEPDYLNDIAEAVRRAFPDAWIGVNYLMSARLSFDFLPPCVDGLWVDNAAIDETSEQQTAADEIAAARAASGWQGLYFGGTAFKYQREVAQELLPTAGRIAARYMDVVTTSGPGTGQAADAEHVARLKDGCGDCPLGLASGVDASNVGTFLPYASAFLVASSIETKFGTLDEAKTRQLAELIHGWAGDN